jgi:hypothetical protein
MFYWYEPILYVDTVSKFPETIEKPGYSICFEDNVGDVLTFEQHKLDKIQALNISIHIVIQSHEDNDNIKIKASSKGLLIFRC